MMNILDKVTDNNILKLIEYIKDSIERTYYQGHVYIVGGAIRDWIMGNNTHDIDIAVDLPNGGVGFANFLACRNGCMIQGKNPVMFPKYGTAKLNLINSPEFGDVEIECVQTRKEQYHSDSRKPECSFGTIQEDAIRRDLTINSLYYNISTNELKDVTCKGLYDIEHEILRTPSNPDSVFEDDPLRILRVIRFANKFNWGIEKETWIGMVRNDKRVKILSQERVTDEINKILVSDKPSVAINRMLCCNNLLDYILPGVSLLKKINESFFETVYAHTIKCVDLTQPILENRLAALFHDIGKLATYQKSFFMHETEGAELATNVLKAMKYPSKTISAVATAIALHDIFTNYGKNITPSKKSIRKFKATVGEYYDLTMDVINANNNSKYVGNNPKQVEIIKKMVTKMEEKEKKNLSVVKLPINGNDIIEKFNVKSGPIVGSLLKQVKEAYYGNPNISAEECFDIVSDCIKKTV